MRRRRRAQLMLRLRQENETNTFDELLYNKKRVPLLSFSHNYYASL